MNEPTLSTRWAAPKGGWLRRCVGWGRSAFGPSDWVLFASLAWAVRGVVHGGAAGGAAPVRAWVGWRDTAGWVPTLSFFVLLKVLDEVMDWAHDQRAQRDSFLLRGEVASRDLLLGAGVLMAAQLAWSVWASARPGVCAAVWVGLMLWVWGLANPGYLASRPFSYSVAHYTVLPGFALWQALVLSPWPGVAWPPLGLLMGVFYAGGLQHEVVRKLRLPQPGDAGGYAGVWGLHAACRAVVLLSLAWAAPLVWLLQRLGAAGWTVGAAVALAVAVGLSQWALMRHPGVRWLMRAQAVSGLSLIAACLLIAVAGRPFGLAPAGAGALSEFSLPAFPPKG